MGKLPVEEKKTGEPRETGFTWSQPKFQLTTWFMFRVNFLFLTGSLKAQVLDLLLFQMLDVFFALRCCWMFLGFVLFLVLSILGGPAKQYVFCFRRSPNTASPEIPETTPYFLTAFGLDL